MRKHAEAEAEKKAWIEQLTKPSGVSDEEGIDAARTSSGERPTLA
jgi:hypothetical protein